MRGWGLKGEGEFEGRAYSRGVNSRIYGNSPTRNLMKKLQRMRVFKMHEFIVSLIT